MLSSILIDRHYIQTMRHAVQYCSIVQKAIYGSKNNPALREFFRATNGCSVGFKNHGVCVLMLTTRHVNITLSSVAPSYSRPPQTQAIMLFTLCHALPRTITLFPLGSHLSSLQVESAGGVERVSLPHTLTVVGLSGSQNTEKS